MLSVRFLLITRYLAIASHIRRRQGSRSHRGVFQLVSDVAVPRPGPRLGRVPLQRPCGDLEPGGCVSAGSGAGWRGCAFTRPPRPGCVDRWPGFSRSAKRRGGPRPGPGGGGAGCPGPGHGRPAPPPSRAGRWPDYSRRQGVGVVLAEDPAAAGQGVLVQVAGGLHLPLPCRSPARFLAERKVSGWSSPRTRRRRSRVSWSRSRAACTSPSSRRSAARLAGGGQGVGVVLAQDPAAAVQGVLVQVTGGLDLAQLRRSTARLLAAPGCRGGPRPGPGACGPGCPGAGRGRPAPRPVAQVGGQVSGGGQGVGVVLAQDPALAVQGVLVQVAGGLHFAQLAQVDGEEAGGGPGCRGGPRPGPGGGGPGCPGPGRGLRRSGPSTGAPRLGSARSPGCARGHRRAGRATAGSSSLARSWPVRVSPRASRYQHASQASPRRPGLSCSEVGGQHVRHQPRPPGPGGGIAGSPGLLAARIASVCGGWRRPGRG